MGNSHSAPTIRPKDIERWNRRGRPVWVDERRRERSPGGRMYTETRRRCTQGNHFSGFGLDEGRGHPSLGRGGDVQSPLPSIPGLYPGPTGGPDIVIANGDGSRFGGRAHVFGPPMPLEQVPIFEQHPMVVEDVGLDFIPWHSLGPEIGTPFRGPPAVVFDFPSEGFPPRRAFHPFPDFIFAEDLFAPRDRPFSGGYGPFTSTDFGRGPPFPSDFPDDTSVESWGPVRGGRSPSPGFVVAEDGVPLQGTSSGRAAGSRRTRKHSRGEANGRS